MKKLAKPIKIAENGTEIPFDEYMFYCRLCQSYDPETHYCKRRSQQPELYINCPLVSYTKLARYTINLAVNTVVDEIKGRLTAIVAIPELDDQLPSVADSIKNVLFCMECWVKK